MQFIVMFWIKKLGRKRPSFFLFDFAARGKPALATQGENYHFSPWETPSGCIGRKAAEFNLLMDSILKAFQFLEYTPFPLKKYVFSPLPLAGEG